jgi:hypothetical protein
MAFFLLVARGGVGEKTPGLFPEGMKASRAVWLGELVKLLS